MCGIAGIFDLKAADTDDELRRSVAMMASSIRHRGPDDSGEWTDAANGIALGFRRLSILDLSEAGHQPMTSPSGRYVVVFNGEIYNHKHLRDELTGIQWRGHSDTEVMLAAFDRWGALEATRRFNGMFAFAVWDRDRCVLTLGRDRMGEKPLYYGQSATRLLFGSELKALRAAPAFSAELDRDALALFMRHGYIPAPHSVYKSIGKLPPAHLVEVSAAGVGTPFPYWSPREASENGLASPLVGDETELVGQLEALLLDAVGLRMEADVPLGAFLSGGIDSSLVVALMQAQQVDPVRTFSIGFSERGYDEAPHAKAVAAHLGTAHTELYVSPEEAMGVIPSLPAMYDEPFSDSSQLPTHLVSVLARRDVTTALSGDGGDELFGGYSRYLLLDQLWGRLQRIPLPVRRAGARAISRVSERRWDSLFAALGGALPAIARHQHPGDKLHKLAGALRQQRPEEIYLGLVSLWQDPTSIIADAHEPQTAITSHDHSLRGFSPIERAMFLDAVTYLPDDILVKVDRAAMAVSLETRVPLLDHRLYEFAWRLPRDQRIRGGVGKHALRQVLYRYVPADLVDRPKMGFGVPIGDWLRGPLREWAEDLLSPRALETGGVLNPRAVRAVWNSHISGVTDEKYRLWAALTLQAWLEEHSRS